jgi:peptidoglycan hydrolase-like protein with peptidoglycan-binding domain
MSILLKIGSSGEQVRDLQKMLNFLNVQPIPLNVDGVFGPKTKASVVQFQSKSFLAADGVVGPITSQKLIASVMSKVKV